MPITLIRARKVPTMIALCVATKYIPDAKLLPEIYQLLEFVTGGPVSSTQLSAAMNESNRFIAFRRPGLVQGWDAVARDVDSVHAWFAVKLAEVGPTVSLAPN